MNAPADAAAREAAPTTPDVARTCVVIGIGPGNGASIARRFAAEGDKVALVARSRDVIDALAAELPGSVAIPADAGDPASITAAIGEAERALGGIDTIVYNAGSGAFGNLEEVQVSDLEQAFRVNTLGAFAAVRAALPKMRERGRGNIVFIGATSSRRGNVRTAAFAPAKAAQRSLAESMAKYLGPQGIHVSLIVVDGVVLTPRARARMGDKPESFFIRPDDLADTAFHLTRQRRSAWSFEVEARPFGETW